MKKVLITGACGFLGMHLSRALLFRSDVELTLVDNFSRGVRDEELNEILIKPSVRFLELDLSFAESMNALGEGYDEVYHLAAVIGVQNVLERPWDVIRINTLSTLHLLEWMRRGGAGKILFSSTSEAYAWTRLFYDIPVPTPENVPLALTDVRLPRSSYAGSKIFGELAVVHACKDLRFTIVRYHNVYGPRMGSQHVIPELMLRLKRGEAPLRVYATEHTRAFCYVDDAIHATISCMESKASDGMTFNIGNDTEEISIGELAKKVMRAVGREVPIEPLPAEHDPISRRCPDLSELRTKLGFRPSISLEEGLHRTASWYLPRISC